MHPSATCQIELNQIACLGDQKYPSFELRLILNYLRRAGHHEWCVSLMRSLNIDHQGLNAPFITAHQAMNGLGAIIDKFYRPGLGHDIAQTYTLEDLGAIGTSVKQTETLREALSISNAYYDLIGSFTDLVNILDADTFTQRQVDVARLDPRVMRFLFELTVTGTLTLAKELSGRDIPLQALHFSQRLPRYEKALYERLYKVRVQDDMKFNAWQVGLSHLTQPLRPVEQTCDASGRDLKQLLDQLKQDESLVNDIDCILKGSAGDFPDPDMISHALGISSRTLRRRLNKVGTSYSALIDKVRCQLAINLIQHQNMSNEALADELGYSDAANFYNAFKKWTGNAPSYYRMIES